MLHYIVKSGPGYFIEFVNKLPHLTTDPALAARLPLGRAGQVISKCNEYGFEAELREVQIAPERPEAA